MAGIYLHIPFCKQACHYCDFHFSTNTGLRSELWQAMAKEIELQKDYLEDEPIDTIYFGGGTPSLLNANELEYLCNAIHKWFTVDRQAEVTLEANPDDLSPTTLPIFRQSGINRLSIGIQSFDDRLLKFFNRAHNSKTAIECVQFSRDAGFNNISLDLIYAVPGLQADGWSHTIYQAIALHPEHISAYSLTLEEKTTFGRWAANGQLTKVDDDVSAQQLTLLVDELERAGYDHYEVSNFSKPGLHSRHNSSYWRGKKYLGIGPSAHSYNKRSRQFNISNNHIYVRSLNTGIIPSEAEQLTREDHVNEYLMTTLRTQWGTDLKKLKLEFNYDVISYHKPFLDSLLKNDLAVLQRDVLKLTRAGKLLADKIAADLFLTH